MKSLFILYTLFFTTLFFGQNTKTEEPAVFIDSNLIARNAIEYINPNEIESVNVIKKDTIINAVLFHGQLYITSKNSKKYDFLTLEKIKTEFTKNYKLRRHLYGKWSIYKRQY